MGVGRVGQSAIYRRIGKSLVCQYVGWWLKPVSDILCVPYESWGASLIYFTGETDPPLVTRDGRTNHSLSR